MARAIPTRSGGVERLATDLLTPLLITHRRESSRDQKRVKQRLTSFVLPGPVGGPHRDSSASS